MIFDSSSLFNGSLAFFADVNECQNGEHNCDVNAQCNNTFGSFNCTCLQGYSGIGVNCSGKLRLHSFLYTFPDALLFTKQKN